MPIKPHFDWEQTEDFVVVQVVIKGFKKENVDVFISDTWVKVNAHPTYLLHLDLLHPIDVQQSSFYCDMPNITLKLKKTEVIKQTRQGHIVVLDDDDETKKRVGEKENKDVKLTQEGKNIWDTLLIDPKTSRQERLDRRQASLTRAEQMYNMKLNTRENIKAAERKRYFQEQWELEKEQRREIERKMDEERREEQEKLEAWRTGELAEEQQQQAKKKIMTPADIILQQQQQKDGPAGIRQNPGEVRVTFTNPRAGNNAAYESSLPTRSRGDEDYYRKSRYKPVSVEDSPMFWKTKGDEAYRAHRWADAADAYSESIKRDGVFLTCTANRAACWLHLHDYRRCIQDCDLAITMLGNMPASDTTQEKYRRTLIKLHARRGAARAWSGDLQGGLNDYRLASAYKADDDEQELLRDCDAIEQYMKQNEIVEKCDPMDSVRSDAHRAYYGGKYQEAADSWRKLLATDDYDMKARNNLTATLLQMGALKEALEQSQILIQQCQEVANALNEPGAQSTQAVDSDDEEGDAADDDTGLKRRNAAARLIRENTGHVYLLLKAYVRAACASSGLKKYKEALEFMENAIRIAPYDNDLRDDANRLLEKIRMDTLVESSTRANAMVATAEPKK
jgi:dyslexia susceptibility 1 candidate gene 1 protein